MATKTAIAHQKKNNKTKRNKQYSLYIPCLIPGTNIDLSKKPRVKHYHEKSVKITVSYVRDTENNLLAYGAVVFRPQNNEGWNKSGHRRTSTHRLRKYPVIVMNLPRYQTREEYNNNFAKHLRQCVGHFGVQSKESNPMVDWNNRMEEGKEDKEEGSDNQSERSVKDLKMRAIEEQANLIRKLKSEGVCTQEENNKLVIMKQQLGVRDY